jgi:excisionase family DNA binding protein
LATDTAELRYYTASETARILRFSKDRTLKLIRDGHIRGIRLGMTIRVSADAIREFEHTNSGPVPELATPVVVGERVNGAS